MTRRILALLAVVALLLAGPAATPALAAFTVVSSTPAAGAAVPGPPVQVQITFDQPVDDLVSMVTVKSGSEIFNDGLVRGQQDRTLVQGVRRMSSGTYEVSWTVGAAPNAPTSSGKFRFTVSAPPQPQAGAGQWIVIAVLAVIIALLGTALVRRRARRPPPDRPTLKRRLIGRSR